MAPPRRPGRAPAVFDDVLWRLDLAAATEPARSAAEVARARFEREGVPLEALRATQAEGPRGTALAGCAKVYVPLPAGPYRIVFQVAPDREGRLVLAFLAFGLRHPPAGARTPSVYERAHRRLHGAG